MGRGEPLVYVEDPNHRMERVFLSDEAYEQVIRSFVIVCTDCMVINQAKKTAYLTNRRIHSSKGWWMIGGRMPAGQHEREWMSKIFKRETSLEISPERFQFVTMQRHFCALRQQEPQDAGVDYLCYAFVVELTPEEIKQCSLSSEEYEADRLQEFTREMIVNLGRAKQALLDLYDLAFLP